MAKIKVNTSGLDKKIQKLMGALNDTKKKSIFSQLGRLAVDIIYKRTKDGYGVTDDSTTYPGKTRLAPLSDLYKKQRKGTVRVWKPRNLATFKSPVTGAFGTPTKSNLTLTGQMLDNLFFKAFRGGFEVQVRNNARHGSNKTNKQIAGYHRDPLRGPKRMFLALTKTEQRILFAEYKQIIRKMVRRIMRSS